MIGLDLIETLVIGLALIETPSGSTIHKATVTRPVNRARVMATVPSRHHSGGVHLRTWRRLQRRTQGASRGTLLKGRVSGDLRSQTANV